MNRGTSLYLDLVRFAAAMTVFVGHLSVRQLSGGLFWQFGAYADMAVSVFFVLSGYVIAHVLEGREHTAQEYAAARLGRLYSVLLPALCIGFLADTLGQMRNPAFYHSDLFVSVANYHNLPERYFATAVFLNRSWFLGNGAAGLEPGSNGALWSLSYEAFYYVAIALFLFLRNWKRWLGLILLGMLAGPTVIILVPTWMLGYVIYHKQHLFRFSERLAIALWIVSAVLWLLSSRIGLLHFGVTSSYLSPAFKAGQDAPQQLPDLLERYASALLFGLNLLAFIRCSERVAPLMARFAGTIRWLGYQTFALYLFHLPLLMVLTVYAVGPTESWRQRIWMIGGTLLVVMTVGRACELSKNKYQSAFSFMLKSKHSTVK